MNEPPTIEHNPHERRQPWWLWWVAFAVFGLLWVGTLLTETIIWPQVMLGVGSGALLTAWAMDMTGGEVPSSWRSKTTRRR